MSTLNDNEALPTKRIATRIMKLYASHTASCGVNPDILLVGIDEMHELACMSGAGWLDEKPCLESLSGAARQERIGYVYDDAAFMCNAFYDMKLSFVNTKKLLAVGVDVVEQNLRMSVK